MANELKKIHPRAKQIYNKPGFRGTYADAVKKAFAEKKSKVRGTVAGRKKRKRAKVGRSTGVLYQSSGKTTTARAAAMGRNLDGGMIGSIKTHLGRAKKMIAYKIGMEEVKKLGVKGLLKKRKIQKRITKYKAQLRKLC
jgi:hypothetical protein